MRLLLCLLSLPLFAETPPEGFRSLFNGKDLSGWYGLNPHQGPKLTGEKKAADLMQSSRTNHFIQLVKEAITE